MEEINLQEIPDYMVGYEIVSKLYDLRDNFIFNNDIEYDTLITNLKIIDLIREVNFVFVKDVGILEDIKEIRKVGNLMNFQVYLDPLHGDDIIMTAKDKEPFTIKVNF